MSLVYLQQGNVKKLKNSMKVVNIDEENLHIFQTAWGISMNFSGTMYLMITFKVRKKHGFTLSLEKPQWGQMKSPSLFIVNLKRNWSSLGVAIKFLLSNEAIIYHLYLGQKRKHLNIVRFTGHIFTSLSFS